MITAKEARQLYNETILLRDKYIEEVIEPLIKKKAPMSQSVSVKAIKRSMSEPSIDFPEPYAQNRVNVNLTGAITKTLIENGYKVRFSRGLIAHKCDIEGNFIISWE